MIAMAIEGSAAETLLNCADLPEQLWSLSEATLPEFGIRLVAVGECLFVLGPYARQDPVLTIFPLTTTGYFEGIPGHARQTVLQRCLRAALSMRRPDISIPPFWAPYRCGTYAIFYSTPLAGRDYGVSLRSVLQKHPGGTDHVLVCTVLPAGESLDLKQYQTPEFGLSALVEAEEGLAEALNKAPPTTNGHEFKNVSAHLMPSQGRTLTEWVPLLTKEQARFLHTEIVGPTKIRGAAGTGKTLALMLKGISELYRASDEGRDWRGVIITHNWSSAEAIRSALSTIDERCLLSKNDPRLSLNALTLQTLAIEAFQLSTPDVRPISEDGHDGKIMQIEAIQSLVAELQLADWSVYRSECSNTFQARVEAGRHTEDARLFAWDLLNEFACVISASRSTQREDYLRQRRENWMMSLEKPADREVVYLLHEHFRALMHDELNALTTYDVVNDYLRWLDTNLWHLKRKSQGFDLVLVDEFHLFNKQENLVFQHLARDPQKPTAAVLALDPRQSPVETFLGFKADKRHPTARLFDKDKVTEVRFKEIFRYTREISRLLDAFQQYWFGFELEDEHGPLASQASATGETPTLIVVSDLSRALDKALSIAREAATSGAPKETVAVLCLSEATFEATIQRIGVLNKQHHCRIISSRDSTDGLALLGRRYAVSQPEYVAGAQFSTVIVVDANEVHVRMGADEQLRLRRVLSSTYLAISRAKSNVIMITATAEGGPLRFLSPALDQKCLVQRNA